MIDKKLIELAGLRGKENEPISRDLFDYFVKEIEANLARCLVLGVSRLDPEWGLYSTKMNTEIRNYGGELNTKLFMYWIISSQLLEAEHKNIEVISKRKELKEFKKANKM